MDDKELADKVVALGVGSADWPNAPKSKQTYYYAPEGYPDYPDTCEGFVRDWRVAGALMEQLSALKISNVFDDLNFYACWDTTSNNKPRAIIEACVEALAPEEE